MCKVRLPGLHEGAEELMDSAAEDVCLDSAVLNSRALNVARTGPSEGKAYLDCSNGHGECRVQHHRIRVMKTFRDVSADSM